MYLSYYWTKEKEDDEEEKRKIQTKGEKHIKEKKGKSERGRGKDKKLYAAFMELKKAYDKVDREALWSVLKIYGVDQIFTVKILVENT